MEDVSFTVKQGEKLSFLGPNGAGKSTTIKMLTGILHPTSGQAEVLGLNPSRWLPLQGVVYVPAKMAVSFRPGQLPGMCC